MNWLTENRFVTEIDYPNQINLDAMAILSGKEVYPSEPCILRSSIGCAKDIVRKGLSNIKTFLGYEKNSFDCNVFMTEFGENALNYEHSYLTLGQVLSTFTKDDWVFCRPVSGWKTFSGGRLDKGKMYDRLLESDTERSTLCLVAPGIEILAEYRLVICEKKVIGSTEYMERENPYVPPEIIDFAEKHVVNMKDPDDIFVLDVAMTKDGPKFIEVNSISTSGLYCVDIPAMCQKVEEFLIRQQKEE